MNNWSKSFFLEEKKEIIVKQSDTLCTVVTSNEELSFRTGHLAGKDRQPLRFWEEWCSCVPGPLPKTPLCILLPALSHRALPIREMQYKVSLGADFASEIV